MHLALGLGLRREEVLGLTWADVEPARTEGNPPQELPPVVHVRRAVTAAGGELHIGDPKTAAGKRDIPLPRFVADALERHRAAQADKFRDTGIATTLIVERGDGKQWQPATFSGEWRKFAKSHGFGGITFHNLRHGAATLLLASGVPDAVAIEVLGHSTTRILKRYQDVVDELKQDAATRMDTLLGQSPAG